MKAQWMIWLLVTGLAYVNGNSCGEDSVETCYKELVNYETKAFPLYGQEAKLDETCRKIKESFECIQNYVEECHESPKCDNLCRDLIHNIYHFNRNTGLKKLAAELCDERSNIKQTYLENYKCLESNFDGYSTCHAKSKISRQYIDTVNGERRIIATCCYFTWYNDCFRNITLDNCGENATRYVTFGLSTLLGNIVDQLCAFSGITCSAPPLPPNADGHEM